MNINDVKVIKKVIQFKGYFEIVLYQLKHRLFNGGWGEQIHREVFERGHAASAILYDPDLDQIVLIEQFRIGAYAALSSDLYERKTKTPWLFEIIAGIIESGETPENVVRRECIEETGCEITDIIPVYQYLVTPGGSSETMFLFCGRVNSATATGIHGVATEGEDIRVFVVSATEAFLMLDSQKIYNSMTIIALQWLKVNRDIVRKKWLKK